VTAPPHPGVRSVVQWRMAAPVKRKRPVLTVTVDADVKARVQALAAEIPGGTVSGVVGELLAMTLPMMESVIGVMRAAQREDGSLDEAVARERMGAWIGTQVLSLYDTQAKLGEGGDDST
jgi:hypothetical protein